MGPQASLHLYDILINLSIHRFGVKRNLEFPNIIIHSIPVPDFISNNRDKNKALGMLQDETMRLNKDTVLCLALACNTAHILLPHLIKTTSIPFVSMIEKVSDAISMQKLNSVGILSTPSTLRYRLYQKALSKRGVKPITPSSKQTLQVERIIRNVIAGEILPEDRLKLSDVALSLQKRGAQGILLGCTELPIVFPPKFSLPVFNSLEILALSLLEIYYNRKGSDI